MGADLMTCVAVWPKDATLDFDAGEQICYTVTQQDVSDILLDGVLGFDLDYDDNGNLTTEGLKDLQKDLAACVRAVKGLMDGYGRNTVTYHMFGHKVLILADMTWGDSIDFYDELYAVTSVPKIATAIGFVSDCFD